MSLQEGPYTKPIDANSFTPNPTIMRDYPPLPGTPQINLPAAKKLATLFPMVVGVKTGPLVFGQINTPLAHNTLDTEPYFAYNNGTEGPISDLLIYWCNNQSLGAALQFSMTIIGLHMSGEI